MSALFDHHVHSDRSDGTVSLEGRAKSVAIRPHGVSDHYPWRDKLRNENDLKRYLEDASRLGLRVVSGEAPTATRSAMKSVILTLAAAALTGCVAASEDGDGSGATATHTRLRQQRSGSQNRRPAPTSPR